MPDHHPVPWSRPASATFILDGIAARSQPKPFVKVIAAPDFRPSVPCAPHWRAPPLGHSTTGLRTARLAKRLKSRSADQSSVTPCSRQSAAIRASWIRAPDTWPAASRERNSVQYCSDSASEGDYPPRPSYEASRSRSQAASANSGRRPRPLKLALRRRNAGLRCFLAATTWRKPISTSARKVVRSRAANFRASCSNASEISSVVFMSQHRVSRSATRSCGSADC
jgi:hypothetical protein